MCEACPTLPSDTNVPPVVEHRRWEPAMNSDFVLWFDQYHESHRPLVGGKNASLGELIAAGLPVPPGFAVTTDAYELLRGTGDLRKVVNALLDQVDHDDPAGLREISTQVRGHIEAADVDGAITSAVAAAYEQLCERCEVDDVPVAVRSSATAEDLPDASFAGQQDTYLWVSGAEDVVSHMRRCWSSMFTDRAISYRHATGYDHQQIAMSVGIQKMVRPKTAGVAFTLNPSDGDRSQIAIDANYGFGETVVSGEVTPDNFLVDKVILEVVRRTVSPKHIEMVLDEAANSVVIRDVEDARRETACMSDDELKAVAAMAKLAEQHYRCPQDVEWAIDGDLAAPDNVVLLQSRPETVWSRKTRRSVSDPGSTNFMDGIVSTLLSPVHTREKKATVEDD